MAPGKNERAGLPPALFTEVDDNVAACRAWGHDWPGRKLRPGRPLPRQYHPRIASDGFVEVTEECLNGCGKKRRLILLPGGIYDRDARRDYVNPRNWPVFPRELGATPRDFQAEMIRRVNEDIMAAARKTAAREEGKDA